MRILATSRNLANKVGPFAVGLGIFDGVHIGHQALLKRVKELADAEGIDSLAYTFSPHPARVLVPDRVPKLLEPIESRLEGFSALGLAATMVERFDREFAAIPAETFIEEILVGKLQARHVVVGTGFTFGAGGIGTTDMLAAHDGFHTHVIDPVELDGRKVSSSRIRELVAAGNMPEAERLLGRPFTLVGLVMRGLMRGQRLGFPTANLQPKNEMLPGIGVYAGHASGDFGSHAAVVNIGYSPTFGGGHLKIEAHLLDFAFAPLYGRHLSLQLVDKLRDERRFASPDELKGQIDLDIDNARALLRA